MVIRVALYGNEIYKFWLTAGQRFGNFDGLHLETGEGLGTILSGAEITTPRYGTVVGKELLKLIAEFKKLGCMKFRALALCWRQLKIAFVQRLLNLEGLKTLLWHFLVKTKMLLRFYLLRYMFSRLYGYFPIKVWIFDSNLSLFYTFLASWGNSPIRGSFIECLYKKKLSLVKIGKILHYFN